MMPSCLSIHIINHLHHENGYSINSYRTTHFQYQALDRIHGEPTLDSILQLFRQLKINAQTSVPTQLGSGQLCNLALTSTATEYNAIPVTIPFQRPTDPGVFQYVLTTWQTVAPLQTQYFTPPGTRNTSWIPTSQCQQQPQTSSQGISISIEFA